MGGGFRCGLKGMGIAQAPISEEPMIGWLHHRCFWEAAYPSEMG